MESKKYEKEREYIETNKIRRESDKYYMLKYKLGSFDDETPPSSEWWFNFGHGHQGVTLGPTTGRGLAEEMISGLTPQPALSPQDRVSPLGK